MTFFNRKFNTIELSIIILVGIAASSGAVLGIIAWINRPVICSTQDGQRVYDLLDQVSSRWDDEQKLADNTSRINLPARISELQAIKRDVEDQDWPTCAEEAKNKLLEGMNYTIDGFITFLDSDNPESLATSKIILGESSFTMFQVELERLKVPQKE